MELLFTRKSLFTNSTEFVEVYERSRFDTFNRCHGEPRLIPDLETRTPPVRAERSWGGSRPKTQGRTLSACALSFPTRTLACAAARGRAP